MKKVFKTAPVRLFRYFIFALTGIFMAMGTGVLAGDLESGFVNPPASAKPWVYWYFMDGNLTREGMTADLEAMKKAGIGGAIFLEVDMRDWRPLAQTGTDDATPRRQRNQRGWPDQFLDDAATSKTAHALLWPKHIDTGT